MMALPDLLTPAVRSLVGVSSTLTAFRPLLVVAEGLWWQSQAQGERRE